jgi:hypothetical protein
MLYEMARRYDEWPGEEYEGSSARGTMKGWTAHGVVKDWMWTAEMKGPTHLNDELAKEATAIPVGAYYRVLHRQIRDMHAAIFYKMVVSNSSQCKAGAGTLCTLIENNWHTIAIDQLIGQGLQSGFIKPIPYINLIRKCI